MHRKIEYFSNIETIESSLRKLSEIVKKASTYDEYVKSWIIYDKVDDSLVYVILKKNLKDIRKILKLLQEKI